MSIQTTKLELMKTILDINDGKLIKKVAEFVNKEKTDFWNELSQKQQQEINQGIQELDKGKRISFDEFLTKV